MTPFRNDESNPYSRESIWPKMPQTPMSLGALPRALAPAPRPAPAAAPVVIEIAAPEPHSEPAAAPAFALGNVVTDNVVVADPPGAGRDAVPVRPTPPAEPQRQAAPLAAPIGVRPARAKRAGPRLVPMIAAGAVGAAGVLALVVVFGLGRSEQGAHAPAPGVPPARAAVALAVPAAPAASATPPVTPPAAAPVTAPPPRRLAAAAPSRVRLAPAARTTTEAVAAAPTPPPVAPAAPEPAPAPAVTIPAAAPPPPTFTPKTAPDPSAPISTHGPDAS